MVEKSEAILSKHVTRLKVKKLADLRLVCDPDAEYETKAQTIDRTIETDYLYFGSSRNDKERELYDIKVQCKKVENNLR